MPHKMSLEEEFEDGSELWKCPDCGRKVILAWFSNRPLDVIDEGTEPQEVHTGGKGGVNMNAETSKYHPDQEYDGPEDQFDRWLKGKK